MPDNSQTISLKLRLIRFAAVGLSGVGVNMGMLWFFKTVVKLPVEVAGAFAIEISIMSNFILNDIWTWRDSHQRTFLGRMWRYHTSVAITAFGINLPVLVLLNKRLGVNYLIANLFGIALAAGANFLLNHFWTYRGKF